MELSSILKALDLNIIGVFTHLHKLAGMEASSENGITVANSGIACDMLNIACCTKNVLAIPDVIKKFSDLNLPFAWWTGFEDDIPNLKEHLEDNDLISNELGTRMFAEISDLPHERKCPVLKIELVDDAQKLNELIEVWKLSFSDKKEELQEFFEKTGKYICDSNSSIKYFVGYYNEQPIAMSSLCTYGNVAGVWSVVVLPEFRKRGIGTEMTSHPLFFAHNNFGFHVGVLLANSSGVHVYEKLGFQKIKDFHVFNVKEKETK